MTIHHQENGEVISILKNRKSVSLNNLEVFKGALCPSGKSSLAFDTIHAVVIVITIS